MTIIHYIVIFLLTMLSIALAWAVTKYYYMKIIHIMTIKNQQLVDRVKKAEAIILNDVLQFSPDDINLLKEKMKGNKQEDK